MNFIGIQIKWIMSKQYTLKTILRVERKSDLPCVIFYGHFCKNEIRLLVVAVVTLTNQNSKMLIF